MNGPVPTGFVSQVLGSSNWLWAMMPKRFDRLRNAGNARHGTLVVTTTLNSSFTLTSATSMKVNRNSSG